jgi:hypothetical protein
MVVPKGALSIRIRGHPRVFSWTIAPTHPALYVRPCT